MTDATSAAPTNRILFIDGNEILCGTMAREISRIDGSVCLAWATAGADPTPEIAAIAPDMIVADPKQADVSPEALRRRHLDMFGEHESVAYIPSDAAATARACLRSNYTGIISRGASLKAFREALESIIAGGFYVDGVFGQIDAAALAIDDLSAQSEGLTEREKEILVQVAKGRAAKEIARDLRISPKTVETYKYRAMSKLSLTDRGAVYDFAEEQAWLA